MRFVNSSSRLSDRQEIAKASVNQRREKTFKYHKNTYQIGLKLSKSFCQKSV